MSPKPLHPGPPSHLWRWGRAAGAIACFLALSAAAPTQPSADQTHWAFRPLASPTPPKVSDASWPLTVIDRFIAARHGSAKLRANGDADRYTWLRRVTFDLTGLPPTVDEVLALAADGSPEAYARVVDRLLGSPAFGERWGRHWLDLVGYADEIGASNNVPAVHAWRYRDYVIAAFNRDLPFDAFIREQIAGDLLPTDSPTERSDRLTATGFLLLGELNIVDADKTRLRMDVIDHQIDKVGKAFLAMTLACARCHDHKFDPVTLKDYYGLAGIFGSTESVYYTGRGAWSDVRTRELPETDAQKREREARLRSHEEKVESVRAMQRATVERLAELECEMSVDPAEPLKKEKNELNAKLGTLAQRLLQLDFNRPVAPLAYAVSDVEAPSDSPIYIRGDAYSPGEPTPRGFVRAACAAEPATLPRDRSGRLELARWLADPANPLTARVAVNRVWRHLFGEGLVPSEDYFGVRGERPSHPQLLDYLAHRFIQHGWSHKELIRQVVLSRVYRMGSAYNAASARTDPDNRLLWRMSPRRLEAEAIRDAALAVSDGLQACPGGPALALEYPENIHAVSAQDVNPTSFSVKKFRPGQVNHRSVYLPIIRAADQRGPAELFNFFDFPHPALLTGERPVTTVPSQALILMNGPLFKEAADRLATSLLAPPDTDATGRVTRLYLRVLGRPPTEEETAQALAFVADASPESWASLSHALLTCNEFLFRL